MKVYSLLYSKNKCVLGGVIGRGLFYCLYQFFKMNFILKLSKGFGSGTNNINLNHYILKNPVYEFCKLIVNIYYFRRARDPAMNPSLVEQSTEFLTESAIRIMKKCRARNPEATDEILIPRTRENAWSKEGPLYKTNLIREITGQYPHNDQRISSVDEDNMHHYLLKVSPDALQDPRLEDIVIYLPAGAPILDFLYATMDRTESWKALNRTELSAYQKNRGLSYRMLREVEVREIAIGKSSEDQIQETILWFWNNYNKDQEFYPSRVVAMDCEYLTISLYDLYRLSGKIPSPNVKLISPRSEQSLPGLPEDQWENLPVKMKIGNGISYALIISLNLEKDHENEYLVKKMTIQDSIISFLESLPLCMGLGVKKDVEDLEYYYKMIFGKRLSMRGTVDLSALALSVGYAANSRSMTTMGVQILGTVLNKTVSRGDDKWAWAWNDLPGSLQIYAVGDLRFSHMSYNVLSSVMVRDFFPDPDITCKYFNSTNQWEVFAWFLDLISYTLDGLEVNSEAYRSAVTRIELMKCLRYRHEGSREIMDECPTRVRLWIKLLGDWPSITAGGCRSLIQARSWFTTQANILRRFGFKSNTNLEISETTEYLGEYARFGLPQENINHLVFTHPVRGYHGLSYSGMREFPLLSINPRKTKCSTIGKFCSKQKRVQKWIIFEWSRLNPNRIPDFLNRMRSDGNYRKFYAKIYDGLRQMYERLHDQDGIRVPELDEKQDGKIKSQLDWELARIMKMDAERDARRSRVDYLRKTLKAGPNVERSLWHANLPQLPARTRVRARSRSRSKPSAKKPKVEESSVPNDVRGLPEAEENQDTEEVLILEPNDLTDPTTDPESEEVVVLEPEDITDPTPNTAERVGSGGEERKSKERSYTYDEIVEAGIYGNSDEEYDLETQFSGHLA